MGLCDCCRSRQVCHKKESECPTLSPPISLLGLDKAVFSLITSVPLPELSSLAVTLLVWIFPWVLLCGYKLSHLPLPDGQEEISRDCEGHRCLWVSVTSSVPSCGTADATASAGGYCHKDCVRQACMALKSACWERCCHLQQVMFAFIAVTGFLTHLVKCRCWNDQMAASS